MSLFSDDCPSSDSENDADYVPEYSSDEEPPLSSNLVENETEKSCKLPESNDVYYEVENTKGKADDLFKSFLAECETEIKAREVEAGIFVEQMKKRSLMSTTGEKSQSSTVTSPSTEVSKSVSDSPPGGVAKESPPDDENSKELFDFAAETVCVSKDGGSGSVLNEASDLHDSPSECVAKIESSPDEKSAIEVFDFAGETVCVSKDGDSGSVLNEVSDLDDSPAEFVAKKESPPDEKNAMEVFDFAGETVCVSKDGGSGSVLNEASDLDKSDKKTPVVQRKGLASVLGLIDNKKPKLSTLEKSKLDWASFKRQQGIEEDLKQHNLGKGGFIERKRFLERSDLRAFEIEREMRLSKKKK